MSLPNLVANNGQHTGYAIAFYHSQVLFGPMGLCTRVFELEGLVQALTARLAVLEARPNPQPPVAPPMGVFNHFNYELVPYNQVPPPPHAEPNVRTEPARHNVVAPEGHDEPMNPLAMIVDPSSSTAAPALTVGATAPPQRSHKKTSRPRPLPRIKQGRRRQSSRGTGASSAVSILASTSAPAQSARTLHDNPSGDGLICCDGCTRWYHVSCTDVTPGDPRLMNADLPFLCEACTVRKPGPRKLLPVDQKSCGRCAQVLENDDEYVVERIIGKRTVVSEEAPHTSRDEYLVKWEGYPASQADWMTAESIGSLFKSFLKDFEKQTVVSAAAAAETVKRRRAAILLKEARDAGWKEHI